MDTSRRLDRLSAPALTRTFAHPGYPTHEVVAELIAELGTDVAMGTSAGGARPTAFMARREVFDPGHQIRSLASPVPTRPFVSPLVLVNGRLASPSRTSVPARHAPHGRNVVAVSGCCRQTGCLATGRFSDQAWPRAPDFRSGAPTSAGSTCPSSTTPATRPIIGAWWPPRPACTSWGCPSSPRPPPTTSAGSGGTPATSPSTSPPNRSLRQDRPHRRPPGACRCERDALLRWSPATNA
jgi:hypothetical protein